MMSILNRWRQFGRRYFWPHLLLGMVAASFGVPTNLNETQEPSSVPNASTSVSRQPHAVLGLTELAALKDAHRRASFGIDYWHQHAIRTVIRHLSFALTVPASHPLPQAESALPAHPQIILDTLNALLTRSEKPPELFPPADAFPSFSTAPHQAGIWLSRVRGIRAGPALQV